MWLYILTTGSIVFLLWKIVQFYFKQTTDDFWAKRGVPSVSSSEAPPTWKMVLGTVPIHDVDEFYYKKFPNARFVGIMEGQQPVLLVRDPELVKLMTVKDFDHFVDRRAFAMGGDLSDSFVRNMHGNLWKSTRATMTPTFTSGKIRRMFDHFDKSADELAGFVKRNGRKGNGPPGSGNEVEAQDIFGRFTMDIIGSTAFGIDAHCLSDDNSPFYKQGLELHNMGFFMSFKIFLIFFAPILANIFDIQILPLKPTNFFRKIVENVISTRKKDLGKNSAGVNQPSDFIQLMIESQRKEEAGNATEQEEEDLDTFERDAKLQVSKGQNQDQGQQRLLTEKVIVANSVTFFVAGFDATETFLTLAAYQLALRPKIQTRLREEIEGVISEFQGKITYDGLVKMRTLEMFVDEIFRFYPIASRYDRIVTKPYKIPGSEVTLPVGTMVIISSWATHMDETHFPNPKEFDIEHFSPENKAKRHPYAFMPFGHGPRSCIAMRFALTEVKAAVAHLVHKFDIERCADTFVPLKTCIVTAQNRPAPGLKVALTKRH